jgi:hypothetical protein
MEQQNGHHDSVFAADFLQLIMNYYDVYSGFLRFAGLAGLFFLQKDFFGSDRYDSISRIMLFIQHFPQYS